MTRFMLDRPGAVFVSYRRGAADVARWVTKVLQPLLNQTLPHCGLTSEPIFIDEEHPPGSGLA